MTMLFAASNISLAWVLSLVGFTVAITVGTIWTYRVWNDIRGETDEDVSTNPADLLEPLSAAFAAGQMSEEEYQRIRQSLVRGELTESTVTKPVKARIAPRVSPRDEATPDPEKD